MVERIRELCEKKNLTIQKLEIAAGLSNGSISKWEKSDPKVGSLSAVASILGVSMEYLMYGEEKQPAGSGELSEDESMLLCFYRALPDKDKPTALLVFNLFRLLPEAERQNVLQRLRQAAGRS